jgi:hypothetical protein
MPAGICKDELHSSKWQYQFNKVKEQVAYLLFYCL